MADPQHVPLEIRGSVYSLVIFHSLIKLDRARCLKGEIILDLAKIVPTCPRFL